MIVLIVDLETTGFTPKKGQIVEIGIASLDTETGEKRDVYNSLVWDGVYLNENAWIFDNSDLNASDVKNAKPLNVEMIQAIFNEHPVTSFNRNFDFAFLYDAGLKIPKKYECIMLKAQKAMKMTRVPSVLKTYKRLIDPNYQEEHRALADAKDEADILFKLITLDKPVDAEPPFTPEETLLI